MQTLATVVNISIMNAPYVLYRTEIYSVPALETNILHIN